MNKKSGFRKNTLLRLLKTLFEFYPVMLPLVIVCIIFNALISSMPAIFNQKVIAVVEQSWQSGDWSRRLWPDPETVAILATLYALSLVASVFFNRKMAVITQGSLKRLRVKMFNGMQDLPVKYFDTHNHGDIMSYYTNDIDTLRQLISQSIPQLLMSLVSEHGVRHHALLQRMAASGGNCRRNSDDPCDQEDRRKFCQVLYPSAGADG